jgi:hypothetical protein
LDYPHLWILFIPWHFPIRPPFSRKDLSTAESLFEENYKIIYQYLIDFKKQLSARNPAETGIRYEWYALQRYGANYTHLFDKEKIVWGNLNEKAKFSIDKKGACILAPCNMLTSESESIHYLLGFLNSKVTHFFMKQQGYAREGGYVEYKKQFLEHLPVPKSNESLQNEVIKLVNQIISNKENDMNTIDLENHINLL